MKLLRILFVIGMMAPFALIASGGKEAASLLPDYIVESFDHTKEHNAGFNKWLDENPQYLNATDKRERSLLILAMTRRFKDYNKPVDDPGHIAHILSKNPDVLKKFKNNNIQFNALSMFLNFLRGSPKEFGKFASPITQLIIKQGNAEDIEEALNEVLSRIQGFGVHAHYDDGTLALIDRDIIEPLQKQKIFLDKKELEIARDYLTTPSARERAILPRDIGTLMAPSNPVILKIKHAIEDNDKNKLEEILIRYRSKLLEEMEGLMKPLTKAVLENNEKLAEVVDNNRKVLDKSFKVALEIKDGTGYTPFLYAAYIGRPDIMRYLIQQGANTDAKTKDNVGALDFAQLVDQDYQTLINEELNARRLRLEKEEEEAKKVKENEKIFLQENSKKMFEMVESNDTESELYPGYVCTVPIINMRNSRNLTLSMVAAGIRGDNPSMIEFLFALNPDLALKDDHGNTALHVAILSDNYAIANLLAGKMSPEAINAKNDNGFTALDMALKYGTKHQNNDNYKLLIEKLKAASNPKKAALQHLLKLLGLHSDVNMSLAQYNKQLQAQLDAVKPLLSDEQRKNLGALASKLDPKDDVNYYDNAAKIVPLVQKWLKESE